MRNLRQMPAVNPALMVDEQRLEQMLEHIRLEEGASDDVPLKKKVKPKSMEEQLESNSDEDDDYE